MERSVRVRRPARRSRLDARILAQVERDRRKAITRRWTLEQLTKALAGGKCLSHSLGVEDSAADDQVSGARSMRGCGTRRPASESASFADRRVDQLLLLIDALTEISSALRTHTISSRFWLFDGCERCSWSSPSSSISAVCVATPCARVAASALATCVKHARSTSRSSRAVDYHQEDKNRIKI